MIVVSRSHSVELTFNHICSHSFIIVAKVDDDTDSDDDSDDDSVGVDNMSIDKDEERAKAEEEEEQRSTTEAEKQERVKAEEEERRRKEEVEKQERAKAEEEERRRKEEEEQRLQALRNEATVQFKDVASTLRSFKDIYMDAKSNASDATCLAKVIANPNDTAETEALISKLKNECKELFARAREETNLAKVFKESIHTTNDLAVAANVVAKIKTHGANVKELMSAFAKRNCEMLKSILGELSEKYKHFVAKTLAGEASETIALQALEDTNLPEALRTDDFFESVLKLTKETSVTAAFNLISSMMENNPDDFPCMELFKEGEVELKTEILAHIKTAIEVEVTKTKKAQEERKACVEASAKCAARDAANQAALAMHAAVNSGKIHLSDDSLTHLQNEAFTCAYKVAYNIASAKTVVDQWSPPEAQDLIKVATDAVEAAMMKMATKQHAPPKVAEEKTLEQAPAQDLQEAQLVHVPEKDLAVGEFKFCMGKDGTDETSKVSTPMQKARLEALLSKRQPFQQAFEKRFLVQKGRGVQKLQKSMNKIRGIDDCDDSSAAPSYGRNQGDHLDEQAALEAERQQPAAIQAEAEREAALLEAERQQSVLAAEEQKAKDRKLEAQRKRDKDARLLANQQELESIKALEDDFRTDVRSIHVEMHCISQTSSDLTEENSMWSPKTNAMGPPASRYLPKKFDKGATQDEKSLASEGTTRTSTRTKTKKANVACTDDEKSHASVVTGGASVSTKKNKKVNKAPQDDEMSHASTGSKATTGTIRSSARIREKKAKPHA